MPRKSNLDSAFEKQIAALEPTQGEMVKAEMRTWKWNRDRINDIEDALNVGGKEAAERKILIDERHKLISENTSLYSHINRALKGTASSEDELDAFIAGR